METELMGYMKLRRLLQTTVISFLSCMAAALPARSADNIYLDYGPFGRVLPITSLESFAENGTIDDELAPYLKRLPLEQQQKFQQVLGTPIPELGPEIPEQIGNPFALSQWLYSPIGEFVLARLGNLIQTQGRRNGEQAIRAALILTAAEPDGGSLIELIRNYPTGGIRLNLAEILALYRAINTNVEVTQRLGQAVTQASEAAAAAEPALNYGALPLLAETGEFSVAQRSLLLQDNQRSRTFPVDLYLPQSSEALPDSVPVIVMSHGYGDTRTNAEASAAARKLASNGFVVAIPEHVDSNKSYQADLSRGLNHDSFDVMEFINRPLDIRFLLDTLEQLNDAAFQGRLQLESVGLMGHSFGGYTALATAGATVDIDFLEQQCDVENPSPDKVNFALLLQCRLLELAAFPEGNPEAIRQLTDGSLADERVGVVFALAPVSSLFGQTGMGKIQSPTIIMGGTSDIATPIALEQVIAFQGLTTPEKYLYLGDNLSHSPALTRLALNTLNPNSDIAENFDAAEELFSSLIVSVAIAQAQVHLQGDESYRRYLTSSYVESVSVEPVKLHLVRSFSDDL
ncbi:MAG: alpha/beta hydrolase [Cyanobacteria bacterium P01_A01_bin.37]